VTKEITENEQGRAAEPPAGLAEQLVAAAREQGLALTGPGGLLTGLTKQVLETALEVEMSEHLGHDRHERSGSGNVRNGSSAKTVRTDIGDVRIAVPRDRAGSFIPAVVHARRLAGFDEAVLSLYAKGLTTGDIANHLADVYGTRTELVTLVCAGQPACRADDRPTHPRSGPVGAGDHLHGRMDRRQPRRRARRSRSWPRRGARRLHRRGRLAERGSAAALRQLHPPAQSLLRRGAAGLGDERRAAAPGARGPVRVVVPGYIGARSVKWVRRITAQAQPSDSYFQAEDYRLLPADAEPGPGRGISLGRLNLTSAILSPDDGARLPAGPTHVTGYALAGQSRTVARVDVSLDGGQTWTQAAVDDPPSPWAWQLWRSTLDLPSGLAEIIARAWDDTGATQPESPASVWNPAGYNNNSWPRIRVDAG
jgi:hypothetical protein